MLLQVVLCAYAQGIVSSRGIERACREQVTFIALCGDAAPHFTTIAHFVSTLGEAPALAGTNLISLANSTARSRGPAPVLSCGLAWDAQR